jgi:hypothetical protein
LKDKLDQLYFVVYLSKFITFQNLCKIKLISNNKNQQSYSKGTLFIGQRYNTFLEAPTEKDLVQLNLEKFVLAAFIVVKNFIGY